MPLSFEELKAIDDAANEQVKFAKNLRQKYTTARQIANLLGITPAYVRTLAKQGRIPAFQVNGKGRIYFIKEDVEKFIEKNRIGGGNGV